MVAFPDVVRACKGVAALCLAGSTPLWASEGGQASLEPIGYFRIGVGRSEGGGNQVDFQAPGARAKYRLGNEANWDAEPGLEFKYKPADSAASLSATLMVAGFSPFGATDDFHLDRVAQAYVALHDAVAPGISLWLGRRYYDRKDIHLSDHCWLNPGQAGQVAAGVEGIPVATGKLNLALFLQRDEEAPDRSAPFDSYDPLRSRTLDLRLTDLQPAPDWRLTLWAQSARRDGDVALGFPAADGYAAGLWLDQTGRLGGRHTLALLYRQGAAVTQSDFNPNPVREDQGYRLAETDALEINANLFWEYQHYAVQAQLLWRREHSGISGVDGDRLDWYSAGARPMLFLSRHWNLATEAGIDRVEDRRHGRDGNLVKATVALQWAADRTYYARPVWRLFVTAAHWSHAFEGAVGVGVDASPFARQTHGLTVGTQLEHWW